MFDGSHYPIEENVAKTKELVAVCKEKGLSIEAKRRKKEIEYKKEMGSFVVRKCKTLDELIR